MKYVLFFFMSFCVVTGLFYGCKTVQQPPTPTLIRDSIYIQELVPYPVLGDTAILEAYLECNEEGKVVINQLDIEKTKNIDLLVKLDSLGRLLAEYRRLTDTIYLPSEKEYITQTITQTVEVEKKLSKFQKFKLDFGGYMLGAIGGLLLVLAFQIYRKIKPF